MTMMTADHLSSGDRQAKEKEKIAVEATAAQSGIVTFPLHGMFDTI